MTDAGLLLWLRSRGGKRLECGEKGRSEWRKKISDCLG